MKSSNDNCRGWCGIQESYPVPSNSASKLATAICLHCKLVYMMFMRPKADGIPIVGWVGEAKHISIFEKYRERCFSVDFI